MGLTERHGSFVWRAQTPYMARMRGGSRASSSLRRGPGRGKYSVPGAKLAGWPAEARWWWERGLGAFGVTSIRGRRGEEAHVVCGQDGVIPTRNWGQVSNTHYQYCCWPAPAGLLGWLLSA